LFRLPERKSNKINRNLKTGSLFRITKSAFYHFPGLSDNFSAAEILTMLIFVKHSNCRFGDVDLFPLGNIELYVYPRSFPLSTGRQIK